MSALSNKFGCKAVTIVGSILACFAYFISTYSTNVDVLILTYGALGGQSVCVYLLKLNLKLKGKVKLKLGCKAVFILMYGAQGGQFKLKVEN